MPDQRPPTIDPLAAQRWAKRPQSVSPWLHEEVARRMEERLQWIKMQPQAWADWEPVRGGLLAHAALRRRYPAAMCFVVEPCEARARVARPALGVPWWRPSRWLGPPPQFGVPPDGAVQMVWSSMALHMAADPQSLIAQWHRALAPEGFLMFSCLGPDTLRELRDLYAVLGWPPPAHEFTDMHDWGDMLVHAGFAEPVMDMERITLTFESGERLFDELRALGRNLHPARFHGLRGRQWRAQLLAAVGRHRGEGAAAQRLPLTFEVIYGHALKARPRLDVRAQTSLSLDDMRRALRQGRAASVDRH